MGVDPYYLAQKAQEFGYHPGIILAGRRMNDEMGDYVASQVIKLMIDKGLRIKNADVLILGIAFKENCPDVRNTKVIDVIKALKEYSINVDVYDPWVDERGVELTYDIRLENELPTKKYDGIVLAVAHDEFKMIDLGSIKKEGAVVYDVKSFLPKNKRDKAL